MTTPTLPDLSFANHGSIWLLTAHTETGEQWIADHIPEDAMTLGPSIAVEHRFVDDIANGAMNDGLTVA